MPATVSPEHRQVAFRMGYRLASGLMLNGTFEQFMGSRYAGRFRNKVQLIFTSPPFPLNRKKAYGNKVGSEYLSWLQELGLYFRDLLTPDGSLVIELGNAWNQGSPTMSTLPVQALLAVMQGGDFHLCEQFVCHNPARLPGPVQWVNKERIRVKDAFTSIWWMSPAERPYADNRNVLAPYSARMHTLLNTKKYNSGPRPSGHNIGEASFLKDNGGAIPGNVLTLPNTRSADAYRRYCLARGLAVHPARMQPDLARFFLSMLTRPGDTVLDPFAGSNTTGAEAHDTGRRWLSVEVNPVYVEGSRGRFKYYRDKVSTPEVAANSPAG